MCVGYEKIFCAAQNDRELTDEYAKRSRQCKDYVVAHNGKDTEDVSVDIWGEVNYYPNKNKPRVNKIKTYEKLKLL